MVPSLHGTEFNAAVDQPLMFGAAEGRYVDVVDLHRHMLDPDRSRKPRKVDRNVGPAEPTQEVDLILGAIVKLEIDRRRNDRAVFDRPVQQPHRPNPSR